MPESTETNPSPTTSSPEPGSAADWGAPEPGETRLPPPEREPAPEPHVPAESPVEGDDERDAEQRAADDDDPIGDDPDEGGEGDDTPDFWAKEDKEFWKQVPPELKPILQKYEKQRIEFANQKAQEAAGERKKAMDEAAKAGSANEQYAKWWQENGPVFAKTFVDKWQGVDWDTLATENPAEWARLSQMRAKEHQLLTQAHSQAEAGRVAQETRVKQAHQEARVAEHGKLAAKYPKEFGTPEAAKKAYDALGNFLAKKGFAAERINNVYEAPLVEIVRMAYKYEQLQAKAKGITNPRQPAQSASTTPTRVVPGARQSANPQNDAQRQAVERLRSGAKLTQEEASEAFR